MFEPKYQISEVLSELLTEIAVLRERIVSAKVLPKREVFLTRRARARMIHSSTAIEGNPLDLRDVEAVMAGKIVTGTTKKDILEVVNYQEVLEFIDSIESKAKIKWEESVLEIHRLTTKDRLTNDVYWIFAKGGIEKQIYKAVLDKKDYTLNTFKKDERTRLSEEN